MVANLLKMASPDWTVPDDTTLCRRQKALAVQIPTTKETGAACLNERMRRSKRLTRAAARVGWTVPDFSTLSRRQNTLAVSIPYRGSRGPLLRPIDSTGIPVAEAAG